MHKLGSIPCVISAIAADFKDKLINVKRILFSLRCEFAECEGSVCLEHRYIGNSVDEMTIRIERNRNCVLASLKLITFDLVKGLINCLFDIVRLGYVGELQRKDLFVEAREFEAVRRDFNSLVEHIKSDAIQLVLEESANSNHGTDLARILRLPILSRTAKPKTT